MSDNSYSSLADQLKSLAILLLLLTMLVGYCGMEATRKAELQKQANSFAALLQDTLPKTITKHDTVWSGDVNLIPPEVLAKSPAFEQLRYDQQMTIIELIKKYDDLLAMSQAHVTAVKADTQRISVTLPCDTVFQLIFVDSTGGFTYLDTITVAPAYVQRSFHPKLRFTPDVRFTKEKTGVKAELRFTGLEEFDVTVVNGYTYYVTKSAKEIKREKWKKGGLIIANLAGDALFFYGGTKLGQRL